jgi:hypothetical protein
LLRVTVQLRGEAHLGEDQRPVLGHALEMPQVRRQLLGVFQEDVERREVLPLDVEELCGGEARIRGEHLGVALMNQGDELGQCVLDGGAAVHPGDVGRHLVADRHGEYLRASGQRLQRLVDSSPAIGADTPVAASGRLRLHPPVGVVQPHQEAKTQGTGAVEQIRRRYVVRPDSVEPAVRHRRQVGLDMWLLGEAAAVMAWQERAVRHPLDAKRRRPQSQMLAVRNDVLHACVPSGFKDSNQASATFKILSAVRRASK